MDRQGGRLSAEPSEVWVWAAQGKEGEGNGIFPEKHNIYKDMKALHGQPLVSFW